MDISHGEPSLSWDHSTLLHRQLPALAARTIGTVVRTAAADQELWVGGDMDVWFVGTLRDVLEGVWSKRRVSIDTLHVERGMTEEFL